MYNHGLDFTTIAGMLVVTAALSAIVSGFVKEKLFPKLAEDGASGNNHTNGRKELCPYHYQIAEQISGTLKTFEGLARDIKHIQELYFELDKKISIFIATGQEKFESVQEVVTAVNQLKGEIKQLNVTNWKGGDYT